MKLFFLGFFEVTHIIFKHFPTNPKANWTYAQNIEIVTPPFKLILHV